jgi:hypothetical protein
MGLEPQEGTLRGRIPVKWKRFHGINPRNEEGNILSINGTRPRWKEVSSNYAIPAGRVRWRAGRIAPAHNRFAQMLAGRREHRPNLFQPAKSPVNIQDLLEAV